LTPADFYVLVLFMSATPDMAQRHTTTLTELTEIAMVMARGLRTDLETAETPEAKARAVAAFPAVARAVRQCVALEAKLQRDQARQAREETQAFERDRSKRLRTRKAQVRLHMERAIANAFADDGEDGLGDEAMTRLDDLHERLDGDLLDPDFADLPFHEVIATLHRALGMDPPEVPPEGYDPGGDPDETAAPPGAPPAPEPPVPEPYFRDSSG